MQARAHVAPDQPGTQWPSTVFAARSETAGLEPLPSRGCRLRPADRTQPALGAVQRHITSAGHVREFLLALPPDSAALAEREGISRAAHTGDAPDVPMPLVINLHGLLETAEEQQLLSGMEPLALARGWAIAWPQGLGFSWNAGACCGRARGETSDDVQFMRDLVAQLGREMCIDLRRVYATGMSNGGFMSYRLACDASDLFAAVAPVAAVDGTKTCTPARPIPILAVNGKSDHIVPFEGRHWDDFPSAEESMDRWRKRNQCAGSDRELFEKGDAKCTSTSGCAKDSVMILCAIEGGGHTWPGGMFAPYLGKTSDDLDASKTILDFFSAHARP